MESGTWPPVEVGLVKKNTEKIGDYESLEPLFGALNDSDDNIQKNATKVLKDLGWNIQPEKMWWKQSNLHPVCQANKPRRFSTRAALLHLREISKKSSRHLTRF